MIGADRLLDLINLVELATLFAIIAAVLPRWAHLREPSTAWVLAAFGCLAILLVAGRFTEPRCSR